MRAVAIANQKGGCGKTTTAVNLSACLGVQNKRTLLVDLDPQSHATVALSDPGGIDGPGVAEVLTGRVAPANAIVPIAQGLDMLCSSLPLDELQTEWSANVRAPVAMKKALRTGATHYDYAILD